MVNSMQPLNSSGNRPTGDVMKKIIYQALEDKPLWHHAVSSVARDGAKSVFHICTYCVGPAERRFWTLLVFPMQRGPVAGDNE